MPRVLDQHGRVVSLVLNQQHVSLLVRCWTVLDTPGNDEQLSWAKGHISCSHLNRHSSLEHKETIVGLRVVARRTPPLNLVTIRLWSLKTATVLGCQYFETDASAFSRLMPVTVYP